LWANTTGSAEPENTRKPVINRPKSATVLLLGLFVVRLKRAVKAHLDDSDIKSSEPAHRPQMAFGIGAIKNIATVVSHQLFTNETKAHGSILLETTQQCVVDSTQWIIELGPLELEFIIVSCSDRSKGPAHSFRHMAA
jgi:hypothetical protein